MTRRQDHCTDPRRHHDVAWAVADFAITLALVITAALTRSAALGVVAAGWLVLAVRQTWLYLTVRRW